MTQLFFMDESGHDHKTMPYEVRGGFSIHVSKLWVFVQKMQDLEIECFGRKILVEIKGSKLLNKRKFVWAGQSEDLPAARRRNLCKDFFRNNNNQTRDHYTAYGQACLKMAQGIVDILIDLDAVIFATAIPRRSHRPSSQYNDFLRKDQVFLFERFYYFLEEKNEYGLIVMDETDKKMDRWFVSRMKNYFTKTENGRSRADLIVPSPFFVSSDMVLAVQAADLCIYAINWGFRLPNRGMDAETRPEIGNMFGVGLNRLQFKKQNHDQGFESFGITYVPNPYQAGR